MRGEGGLCGERGVCRARNGACMAGGIHGRWGYAWPVGGGMHGGRGACVTGDICGRGVRGRGSAWQGGVCGMHSYSKEELSSKIHVPDGILARLNSGKRLYLHRLTERNRKIRKLLKDV